MKRLNGYLVMRVNGRVIHRTLCTSHVHANNIMRDLLLRWDPFWDLGSGRYLAVSKARARLARSLEE